MTVASITEGTPFSASNYFTGLAAAGARPTSFTGESFGFSIVTDKRAGLLHQWAHLADPDMALRKAFVRSAWEARPEGAQIISLG